LLANEKGSVFTNVEILLSHDAPRTIDNTAAPISPGIIQWRGRALTQDGQRSGFGGRGVHRWLVIVLIVVAPCARAGDSGEVEAQVLCTDAWYRYMEDKVPTGDGQGHGPDIGSDEWRSVIEFRLGIRGKADLPARDSEALCGAIDEIVRSNGTPSEADGGTAMSSNPSYVCDKIRTGSIEAMICEDGGLSRLDRKLADVYPADARHTLCHILGMGSIPHLLLEKPVRSWSLKAGFQQQTACARLTPDTDR
jgi:hypothetical protein